MSRRPHIVIDVGSHVGPYEIVSEIKRGGMATLFVARRFGAAGFTRHVAIKVVHPHLAQDDDFVRMFIDEAKLASQIKHPNVVHVEELGEADGVFYLVMEYIHGCSLSELLRALAEGQRRLRPAIAVWIAAQIARGLHAAHELCDQDGEPLQVVHRDVSPHNILLSVDGHVKLIDFGVAKAERRAVQTKPGALRGKLRYMAPEQLTGKVDRRTDLYALGIVLWEMLVGRRRFIGDEIALIEEIRRPVHPAPSSLVDVPKVLDEVVLAVMNPDPSKRPQTGRDFAQRLIEVTPDVARVDAKDVSEVIRHFASSVIEERRLHLPESITGVSLPAPRSGAQQIVEQLTISQAGQIAGLPIPGPEPSWAGETGKPSPKALILGVGVGLLVGMAAAAAALLSSEPEPVAMDPMAQPPPIELVLDAGVAEPDAGRDAGHDGGTEPLDEYDDSTSLAARPRNGMRPRGRNSRGMTETAREPEPEVVAAPMMTETMMADDEGLEDIFTGQFD